MVEKNNIDTNAAPDTFTELVEWLVSKRLVKEFLDWCETKRGENISRMLLHRTVKVGIEDVQQMTPRQKTALTLLQEFVSNWITSNAWRTPTVNRLIEPQR